MMIFVFGSNLAGVHGSGSAAEAQRSFGAQRGVGEGRTGNAYAIPTKSRELETLPRADVADAVERFKAYARLAADEEFHVVRIGCGLAGFTEEEIRPMFADAPMNCILPPGWGAGHKEWR